MYHYDDIRILSEIYLGNSRGDILFSLCPPGVIALKVFNSPTQKETNVKLLSLFNRRTRKARHRDTNGLTAQFLIQEGKQDKERRNRRKNSPRQYLHPEAVYPDPSPLAYGKDTNYDCGPYDSTALTEEYMQELDQPARPARAPRHSLAPWLDLNVHVWTRDLFFFVPAGVSVMSLGEEKEDSDEPGRCEALLFSVPQIKDRAGFMMIVSAFCAPTSTALWNEHGWVDAHTRLQADGVDVTAYRKKPWGIAVEALARDQQTYVVGADGKRWSVRITAYGAVVDDRVKSTVDEVMRSVVVHRDDSPQGPGTPLDMTLIDRRVGRKALAA